MDKAAGTGILSLWKAQQMLNLFLEKLKSGNLVNFWTLVATIILILAVFLMLDKFIIKPAADQESPYTDIYLADNISSVQKGIIERFNRTNNKGIRVLPLNLSFDVFSTNERKELLTRSLRSRNNRIDIMAVDYVWISRFAKWAEPLENYLGEDEISSYLEDALETCWYEDGLVSVPYYIDVGILFYRKDLLQLFRDPAKLEQRLKESITWEELVALKKSHPDITNPFYVFPANNYEGLICSFMEALQSREPLKLDSLALYTPGEAAAAIKLLYDLIYTYRLSPPVVTNFKERESYEYAFQNDALFFRGWPGNELTYRDIYPDKVAHLGIAALPHRAGGKPGSVYGGWNLMISSASEHKAAAVEFLKYMSGKEVQKALYQEMGLLPTNKSVYEDSAFLADHPELTYLKELLSRGFHRPFEEEYTKKSDIVSYYIFKYLKRECDINEAIAEMAEALRAERVLIH